MSDVSVLSSLEVSQKVDSMKIDMGSSSNDNQTFDFKPLTAKEMNEGQDEFRSVRVPPHRMAPLKKSWMDLYTPIVEHMKLQIRMNVKKRCVELKSSEHTEDAAALQKSSDFIHAFMLGFDIKDAIALLRLDDLYLDTFDIKDGKLIMFASDLSSKDPSRGTYVKSYWPCCWSRRKDQIYNRECHENENRSCR